MYKFNWEDVKEIVESEQYDIFYRNQESTNNYEKTKTEISNKYESMKDMILINFLNYNSKLTDNNKLVSFKDIDSLRTNIIKNNFPYHVEDNISHLVLWSREDLTDNQIKNILERKYKNQEYIYFRNPAHIRSIPSVFHIQVFLKL